MKRSIALSIAALCGFTMAGYAGDVVNDTWLDGTRTDPASPTYSEFGTDVDIDGNIESAWFNAGGGTMTPSAGHLGTTVAAASSSWTTYFTPEAAPINLANINDQMVVTWVFTPTGVTAVGTSQGFRLAVVNSPSASRLAADGAPGTPAAGDRYFGYGMFMNMRTGTLGNGNSFQIMERNDTTVTPGAFLSSSGAWVGRANGATSATPGYTDGAQYTFTMTFTHNALNGLDILATMTGTGLGTNGNGLSVFYSDATPDSFMFDTYGLRPSTAADSATTWDTTLFQVSTTAIIPEPSTFALGGLGALGLIWRYRRPRR